LTYAFTRLYYSSMQYKDYYQVLGVDKSATTDEIRRVYRNLAKKYHPDRNPGNKQAEEKFKEINEANEVLSDPQKRKRYDQLGQSYQSWQQQGGSDGSFRWEDWFSTPRSGGTRVEVNDMGDLGDIFEEFGFSDFFNSIFGGMGTSTRTRRSQSRTAQPAIYEQPVSITFQEAYNGTQRTVQIGDRRKEVKIPAGAKTGTKVRYAGAGPQQGRQKSDLYLVIDLKPDPHFDRQGDDLYSDASIDLYTAVLGGQATITTPSGNVLLTIPAGTQPGQTFRLAGKGMPILRQPGSFGNLFVRIKVQVPKNLSAAQRKMFEDLRRN
jgi:curved DNA-binding protein